MMEESVLSAGIGSNDPNILVPDKNERVGYIKVSVFIGCSLQLLSSQTLDIFITQDRNEK